MCASCLYLVRTVESDTIPLFLSLKKAITKQGELWSETLCPPLFSGKPGIIPGRDRVGRQATTYIVHEDADGQALPGQAVKMWRHKPTKRQLKENETVTAHPQHWRSTTAVGAAEKLPIYSLADCSQEFLNEVEGLTYPTMYTSSRSSTVIFGADGGVPQFGVADKRTPWDGRFTLNTEMACVADKHHCLLRKAVPLDLLEATTKEVKGLAATVSWQDIFDDQWPGGRPESE
jgi:hypothetical protein